MAAGPDPAVAPVLHYPELQGQRGLAAVLVVVFHAYQFDRSGPGPRFPYEGTPWHRVLHQLDSMVDWFFVLSAFLLTLPYARAVLEQRPVAPAKDFLARRAVRIVPLYLTAVCLVWASRNGSFPGEWRDLLEHLTFTQVFDRKRIFYTIGPAWSLAVEVQFYLLLVVLGSLAGRAGPRLRLRRSRVALLSAGMLVLGTVTPVWAALMAGRAASDWPVWFGLPAKCGVFAIGMAAALAVALRPRRLRPATAWLLRLAGLGVLAAAFLTRGADGPSDIGFHSACAAGFAAIVLAGALGPAQGLWHRAWATAALPWAGLVSYSLYMWHEPLQLTLHTHGLLPDASAGAFPLTALVLLGCGLLVGWISYLVVELPASHLRLFIGGAPQREIIAERRVAL